MKGLLTGVVMAAILAGTAGLVQADNANKDLVGQTCDKIVSGLKSASDTPFLAPVKPVLDYATDAAQNACDTYGTSSDDSSGGE